MTNLRLNFNITPFAMNHIKQLDFLALRSRLKIFIDRLQQDEEKVYRNLRIDCNPRWMIVLNVLHSYNAPLSITQIAKLLQRTHPDVHVICNQMIKKGLLKEAKDKTDKRKRLIDLTPAGVKIVDQLKPVWNATEEATKRWIFELAPDFMIYLESLETSLNRISFYDRIVEEIKNQYYNLMQLVPFSPDGADYKLLNQFYSKWKDEYFPVPELESTLANLKKNIFNNGGNIFFALYNGQKVGAVIVKRISFDLAQIEWVWVNGDMRMRRAGLKLINQAISYSREIGCKRLIIFINRLCVPAENLLKKEGFNFTHQLEKNYPPYEKLPNTLWLNL